MVNKTCEIGVTNKRKALPVEYRPKTWDEFLGNESVKAGLIAAFNNVSGRPHAFLLSGPSGTGKTTLARLIKEHLCCKDMNYYEWNGADFRGIDSMRELIKISSYPASSNVVVLLDEAHQITGAGAEALLKLIEEPPSWFYIVLCTTAPEKISPTIKNRCTPYTVSKLEDDLMFQLVDSVLAKEKATLPPDIRDRVVGVAEGCPRLALKVLEQVIGVADEALQRKLIDDNVIDEGTIKEIQQWLLLTTKKPMEKWVVVGGLIKAIDFKNKDTNPEIVRRTILGYFTGVLLNAKNEYDAKRVERIISCFIEPVFDTGRSGIAWACFKACYF